MTDTAPASIIYGFILWAILFFLMWLGGRVRKEREQEQENETRVSRNKTIHIGPSWEQDAPYPECFGDDTEQDDDL